MLSNLPPGVTDRMIEEQANGGCSKCAACGHEDVEITSHGDIEVHGPLDASISVEGSCENCGAIMQGRGTPTGEGGHEIVDIEWEAESCSHGEPDDDPRDSEGL